MKSITTIITLSILVVLLIAYKSGMLTKTANGFSRTILYTAKLFKSAKKPEFVKSPLGKFQNGLLFSTKTPDSIIYIDGNFKKHHTLGTGIKNSPKLQNNFNMQLDGFALYTWGRNIPAIYITDLSANKVVQIKLPMLFTRGVIIGDSAYLLRGFDKSTKDRNQFFYRISTDSVLMDKELSYKFNDGGIINDGVVHFDKVRNQAIYIQFYNNNILWFSPNDLSLIIKTHTIDTFRKIKPLSVSSTLNKKTKLSPSPKRLINFASAIDSNCLYNISWVKADNEKSSDFKNNTVIDIYDLTTRSYKYSIYIPNINGEKLRSFIVKDGKLIGIYNSSIASFLMQ